jgi:hypothetical protein
MVEKQPNKFIVPSSKTILFLDNQILQVVLLKISSKLIFEIYPAPFQAIAEAASLECSTNNIEHPTNPKLSSKHS